MYSPRRYARIERVNLPTNTSKDECSTLGCEVLAAGEGQSRKHIRDSNTWALRGRSDKLCSGGVNLCFAGDFWQFKLIQETSIYDNPFKRHKLSSTETMPAMFWTRESNAVRELFELTREHRYEDPWLSALLLRERHGNMEHELYCFMQRFLPNTQAGCLIAMMYCAAKDGVVHCLQNGSVRYRQEPLKLGNSDVLRNAMFANIIA